MISAQEIESLIKSAIPDADVSLEDLTGGQDHWRAVVVSDAFEGRSRVQQHQLVYAPLRQPLVQRLHALQLTTMTRSQARERGLVQE